MLAVFKTQVPLQFAHTVARGVLADALFPRFACGWWRRPLVSVHIPCKALCFFCLEKYGADYKSALGELGLVISGANTFS